MKKQISTFAFGMLVMALIGGLGVGALAASGAVTFNASNLQLNGQQISAKGENYTLANGQQVPASITYTDETGGGTTYLPVRRISELLGVETGWDGATGSVTVGEATQTPDANFASTDYSKWSAEEEAAYQEFKGMWEVNFIKLDKEWDIQHFRANYIGTSDAASALRLFSNLEGLASRLAIEHFDLKHQLWFGFSVDNKWIGSVTVSNRNGEWKTSSTISP